MLDRLGRARQKIRYARRPTRGGRNLSTEEHTVRIILVFSTAMKGSDPPFVKASFSWHLRSPVYLYTLIPNDMGVKRPPALR